MEKEPSMDSKTGPSASMSPSPPSVIGAPRAGTAASSTPRVATPAAGPALPWDVSEEDEYDMNKDEAGPAQKSHKRKLGSSVSPKATAKRGRVMVNDEMHINIVVIGHVDSGNSDTDKLGVVNGKLVTSKYCCSIIGDPKQAHCAIFIIESATSVSTISKDELIEHSLHAFALGRKQMICCCNKMEAPFSKIHYDEFVKEASLYLSSLGFNPHKISFVPISISKGHNVIERSKNLQWYEGPTLHEAINQITGPKRPTHGLSHKDNLQAFSIKKYHNYPVYITRSEGEPGDSKFWSTVEVDGQHFKSVDLYVRKKEAEQDAAKVAYEFLMARDGDNFSDVLSLVDKGLLHFKIILNEFAEKKKTSLPSYSFHRQKGPGRMTYSVATVSVAGMEFIGEMGKSKKDAKEKAARLAVESILATNDEFMLKTFRSKRRVINAAANSLDNKDGVLSSKPSVKPTMETADQDSEAAPGLGIS